MAEDLQDFTDHERSTEPVRFKIDDDIFEAAAALPAGVSHDFALMQSLKVPEQVVLLGHILESFLLPESAALFASRLRDPVQPITNEQVGQVIKWLVEYYTGRPTEPASSLPIGESAG